MRVGIAGAGAVGCHYGSMLQQSGIDVVYLARGEHLAELQRNGLIHISLGNKTKLEVKATGNPADLHDSDAVLLTCKTTGIEVMCRELSGVLPPECVVVTMQNGVNAPDIVRGYLPENPLIAASAFIGARIDAPGIVNHSAAGHLRLGVWEEPGGHVETVLNDLIKAWNRSGVDARQTGDMAAMLWHKMLWNCGFNAITALTRRFARDIATDEESARWVRHAMQEAIAVAHASGVELPADAIDQHMQLTLQAGEVKTSMWQDIESGRPTEIEAMNGYIAKRAAELGLAAPVNDLLASLIRAAQERQ